MDDQARRDEYFTSKEAQEYLKVSSVTLWRLVKEGQIPVYKIHNRNRYRKTDLDFFMESHRVGPQFGERKTEEKPSET